MNNKNISMDKAKLDQLVNAKYGSITGMSRAGAMHWRTYFDKCRMGTWCTKDIVWLAHCLEINLDDLLTLQK